MNRRPGYGPNVRPSRDGRRTNALKHGLTAAPLSVLNQTPTGLTAALLEGLPPSDDLREVAEAFVVQWHRAQIVQKLRREALQAFLEVRVKRSVRGFESSATGWFVRDPTWPISEDALSDINVTVVERRLAVLAGHERKIASLRRKAVSRVLIETERVAGAGRR